MTPLAWDSETLRFRPGCMAPPLVCITYQKLGTPAAIVHRDQAHDLLESWLRDPSILHVLHNASYDFVVVAAEYPDLRPLIFRAYDEGRVTDTMIRQQLLDIAAGCYRGSVTSKGKMMSFRYDLESCARRLANMTLSKDALRTSYGRFLDVPLARWPDRMREIQAEAATRITEIDAELATYVALKKKDQPKRRIKDLEDERKGLQDMVESDPSRCTEYPLDDARATLACYLAQEKHASYLHDQFRQARAAFALHLSSAWGLRTDAKGVAQLRAVTQAELDEIEEELITLGLVREDGTKDTKAAKARMLEVCKAEGIPVVKTASHFKNAAGEECPLGDACEEHVAMDAETCERTGDDVLIHYALRGTLGKQLSNDIPMLEKGGVYPVHTRYGLSTTGRASSSKPNVMNQSKREGFRESFTPRPCGHVFIRRPA